MIVKKVYQIRFKRYKVQKVTYLRQLKSSAIVLKTKAAPGKRKQNKLLEVAMLQTLEACGRIRLSSVQLALYAGLSRLPFKPL